MRKSGEERRKFGAIDPQVFGKRVAEFLRERHPSKTASNVEADTGIFAKTVSKWLEGASSPSGAAYQRLVERWPDLPAYVSPETAPEILREAARYERQARLEARAATIRQQLADVLGAR